MASLCVTLPWLCCSPPELQDGDGRGLVSDVVLVLPPKKGKSVRPVLNRVSFGVREGRSRVCLLVGASHFLQSLTVSLPHSPPPHPRAHSLVFHQAHIYT